MLDFIIFMLISSPFILACLFGKPLARKWDDHNRRIRAEHQIIKGRRDGRILRETVQDMKRKGRL
jgi:hypothetical protein